jgi:hypothetical protein
MEDKKKRKGNDLTVIFFIGGQQVDKLSPEQCEKMAEKLSQTMSRYYSLNLEEYERL